MELKLINNSDFSLGSTINSAITANCTKAYVKQCPNVSKINVLRQCANLTNVYMDNIGSVSGPISELIRYASMHGYTNEESDNTAKPYIGGTFNVTGYYTTAQQSNVADKISNLTIDYSNATDIQTLFDNDLIAIQTVDSSKTDSYNPAAAIILQSNISDKGTVLTEPIVSGEGRYFILKSEVATITTISNWFTGVTGVTDTNAIVTSDNTQSYTFDEFDELEYFTGITKLGDYNTTNGNGTFQGCSNLASIKLPNTLIRIGRFCFTNACNGGTIVAKQNVTIDNYAFSPSNLSNLYIYNNAPSIMAIGNSGNNTGTLFIAGNFGTVSNCGFNYKKILIGGNVDMSTSARNLSTSQYLEEVRVGGEWRGGSSCFVSTSGNPSLEFIEILGDVKANVLQVNGKVYAIKNGGIIHFGYNTIPTYGITCISASKAMDRISKIYVGSGTSKSSDDATLTDYLNNNDWNTYSTKLDTWWNYNGTYKWYRVTDTLTNCTNTNPVVWPFITRKDSYETTIVADEGYTLDSVQVLMYECVDDTATPAIPTDVTSSVYDSSTGVISIEHVIGNVEIIASATANS